LDGTKVNGFQVDGDDSTYVIDKKSGKITGLGKIVVDNGLAKGGSIVKKVEPICDF